MYFFCLALIFLICNVMYKKNKKSKRKERENNNRKRDVCVCVFFFMYVIEIKKKNEFNILIYMHKYLKDRYHVVFSIKM